MEDHLYIDINISFSFKVALHTERREKKILQRRSHAGADTGNPLGVIVITVGGYIPSTPERKSHPAS